MEPKPNIINCHTHVFKSDAIPPFLAKTFLSWPFYFIFNTGVILGLARFWYNSKISPRRWPYTYFYRRLQIAQYAYRSFVQRNPFARPLVSIINLLLILHAVYYIFKSLLIKLISLNATIHAWVSDVKNVLVQFHLFYPNPSTIIKIAIILFVFLFIKSGRKVLIGILKNGTKLGGLWPDDQSIAFYKRYLNIGRFANYKTSSSIFGRLEKQYDAGTGFILLPMDMAYMGAGPLKGEGAYADQMDELARIKKLKPDTAFPFVFVDPRRITDDKSFLKYTINPVEGKVILEDCFVKKYIETNKFNGFKIYPALGYYPFDDRLLVLWKYAADHGLPITTHAIKGTIYYRGTKKKEWGYHPVFEQTKGHDRKDAEKLLLPELKNIKFINNFTHPLNYFCLVEEQALRHVVAISKNEDVKKLFGFTDIATPLKHDLKKLKLCFGHYGGEDEWARYLELDRNQYAPQLTIFPNRGIDFLTNGIFSPVKMEQLWQNADWYSIISSLILQYDNLYADISYILHDLSIIPLLKTSLQNPKLSQRILYGTDFYVVRNHKSEREMLGEMQSSLSETEFDMIARTNPIQFLTSSNFT
ncbi:MAG: hypothetical protein WBP41_10560 [Saprospiraceae bacterium]